MNDITKCVNSECGLAENCLRFLLPAHGYQSYAHFENNEVEDCYIGVDAVKAKLLEDMGYEMLSKLTPEDFI